MLIKSASIPMRKVGMNLLKIRNLKIQAPIVLMMIN
jgi:hypothetical protein